MNPVVVDRIQILQRAVNSKLSGNCQEYEAGKKKRLGEEGAKPKRIRFKPLK